MFKDLMFEIGVNVAKLLFAIPILGALWMLYEFVTAVIERL